MIFLSACLGIGSGGCTCCLRSLVGDLFSSEEETSTAMSTTFFVLSFTAGSGARIHTIAFDLCDW